MFNHQPFTHTAHKEVQVLFHDYTLTCRPLALLLNCISLN